MKILIIEDDKGIAEAIKAQAEMWELQAKCVQDFRNVMAEFAEYDPQLVLLDIALPFFNGYHWCSEIRKVSQVPIIFISSASDNMKFAFSFIWKILLMFGLNNMLLVIGVNLICFAVFGFFYAMVYKITSNSYYSIVSGEKE